ASSDVSKAGALVPDHLESWVCRGLIHLHPGQIDRALADAAKAIERKQDFDRAHWLRGCALLKAGEFHAALEALKRGHQLGLKDPEWDLPSEQWIKECEALIRLDA